MKQFLKFAAFAGFPILLTLTPIILGELPVPDGTKTGGSDSNVHLAATLSEKVSKKVPGTQIITREDISGIFPGPRSAPLFPNDLDFPNQPAIPQSRQEIVALLQRIVLLENRIAALELPKKSTPPPFWPWEIGWLRSLWIAFVFLAGVAGSTSVAIFTKRIFTSPD